MQSQPISLDAPIEGWDAYHSMDNMPPTAAIILDNMIPGAGSVDSRKGSRTFADTGTGQPVETLASFESATESKLVAASAGGLWDMDDVGVINNISPAATFQNDRWQYTNFRKLDETGIMILCNGQDVAQIYNGTTVTPIDITGTTGTTGNFIGCLTFKGRVYYWEDNSNEFWYAAAGSYQGELNKFELGTSTRRGGKIVLATTWTQQDSGDGKDDYIVFMFSTGEILVYQGDDPVENFEVVGRYMTGEPLSIRGVSLYGADAIVMTKDGYVSLSSIIQEGRTSDVPQFSRLIHTEIKNRTEVGADLYGWDCELFPADGLFIFNVPTSRDNFVQHVMNTVTERWCRFIDLNVNCITVNNDRLFGGDQTGKIISLLEGVNDDDRPIQCAALYAFNYLGDAGRQKFLTAAQVLSTNTQPADITLIGYADFKVPSIPTVPAAQPLVEAEWSVEPAVPASPIGSYWDEHYWSVDKLKFTTKGWQNVSAYGYAISLLVRMAKVNERVIWRSTNMRFHMGGAQ